MGQVFSWKPFPPFTKDKWATYFGDVGAVPPLPRNLDAILSEPCPFFPGQRVRDTHIVCLFPKTVNGKVLTMNSFGEIIQHPRTGRPMQYSRYSCDERVTTVLGDKPLDHLRGKPHLSRRGQERKQRSCLILR
jgi:hypothetical protein